MIDVLRDEDPKVGAASATALGAIGPAAKTAVPALADVVTDPKSTIRVAAIYALGMIRLEPDICVPTLIGALAVEETRKSAYHTLAGFASQAKAAVPALLAFSREAKGSVRVEALHALSQVEPNGEAFSEVLFAALRDANPFVRGEAVDYCGRDAGVPAALPVLVELFKVDGNLRNRIAYTFGAMGAEAKPVAPMLLEMIRDPETSQHLRRVLINSLRAIDPEAIKPPGK